MEQTFRDSDIQARLGGHEFAIWLTDCVGPVAYAASGRLTAILSQLNVNGRSRYFHLLSLGLAQFNPNNHVAIHALMALADAEMYAKKRRASERSGR